MTSGNRWVAGEQSARFASAISETLFAHQLVLVRVTDNVQGQIDVEFRPVEVILAAKLRARKMRFSYLGC